MISAAVMLPVVIGLLWLGGYWFAGLVAVAACLMISEWETMTQETGLDVRVWARVMALLLTLAVLLSVSLPPMLWLGLLFAAVLIAFLAGLVIDRAMFWRVLGLIWLGLPCVGLVWLREHDGAGVLGVLWLLSCVWSCDTGAYFAGKSIGGAKLAPSISPGKTWAGLFGGLFAAAAVSAIFSLIQYDGALWMPVTAGVVIAFVSQIGDLAESAVKRRFEVKDSGQLIPGHGGILDRVDGLLFAIPAGVALLYVNQGMVWAWR